VIDVRELRANPYQYSPSRTSRSPWVVRVRGLADGVNALGGPIQVPHVEYVAVWPGDRVE
jgi:hypothetical protein